MLGRCKSHSARSAWIETFSFRFVVRGLSRRTPQGVRGLKPRGTICAVSLYSRTPQGVRGLKLGALRRYNLLHPVALRKECVD